ncbi:caspase domain-containing protein [Dongia sp.]|uniref:caspase family protein n=1 Tax=Dongia sp. TaxID=1977262 RepID=UPI0035B1A805
MTIAGRVHHLLAALLAGLILCWGAAAMAEPRLALVIGNGKYGGNIGSLINPPNDANLMAERLAGLGFKVTKLVDGDQTAMKRAISAFGQALSAAGPDAVGLFFYAGHGVQVDGTNYLIPTNAAINAEADVDLFAVSAESVLKQMEYAGARVNIVILDACRNNPLPRSVRSASRGLARMDAPTGSFIGYSTAPGNVANDGGGRNSPYTAALAAEMARPGIAIEEAFRNVRVKVMATTEQQQVPWESSSLTGAFFFQPASATGAAAAATPAPENETAAIDGKEQAYWSAVKDSRDASDFEAYLGRYPNGRYADVARDKAQRLRNSSAEPETQAVTQTAGRGSDAPEPEAQVAALPPADAPLAEEPSGPAPDGTLRLSSKVSGQLKSYLSQLKNHNGAFAVSPDGQYAGSYVCAEIGQCVSGKKGLPQNTDPSYPQKTALQKCRSAAKQECVIVLVRGEKRKPYLLAGE